MKRLIWNLLGLAMIVLALVSLAVEANTADCLVSQTAVAAE